MVVPVKLLVDILDFYSENGHNGTAAGGGGWLGGSRGVEMTLLRKENLEFPTVLVLEW